LKSYEDPSENVSCHLIKALEIFYFSVKMKSTVVNLLFLRVTPKFSNFI